MNYTLTMGNLWPAEDFPPFFCPFQIFLLPLALPKVLALGNKKKKFTFSFVFLSLICTFAAGGGRTPSGRRSVYAPYLRMET